MLTSGSNDPRILLFLARVHVRVRQKTHLVWSVEQRRGLRRVYDYHFGPFALTCCIAMRASDFLSFTAHLVG